jgi:fatty acid desaturase
MHAKQFDRLLFNVIIIIVVVVVVAALVVLLYVVQHVVLLKIQPTIHNCLHSEKNPHLNYPETSG